MMHSKKEITASAATFLQQIESGKTRSDAAKICKLMQDRKTLNTRAIAALTGIKESTVTARIDRLRELGLMRPISEFATESGYVTIWGFVANPDHRENVSRQYLRGKYIKRLQGLLSPKFAEFCEPALRERIKLAIDILNPAAA